MAKIFVFGSNLQGIHGKGAALHAKINYGARQGQGEGRQGNSYAIPTKETPWVPLPLEAIRTHVGTFISYANSNPSDRFFLTAVGCGLAGYDPVDIAPFFVEAPENVILPEEFFYYVMKER